MLGTQHFLIYCDCLSVEGLGRRVLFLIVIETGEVNKRRGHAWMLGSECLLRNRQRSSIKRFRGFVVSLVAVHGREIVQAAAHVGAIPPGCFLDYSQYAFVERFGQIVLS